MQSRTLLQELLAGVTAARDEVTATSSHSHRPKLLLKIAPDLSESEVADIAAAVRASSGVDGVIVSNTTVQRPSGLSDRTFLPFLLVFSISRTPKRTKPRWVGSPVRR